MLGTWIESVIWSALFGVVVAISITPAAARLMWISEGWEPWPRPLGFWILVRVGVAEMPSEEEEVVLWEERVRWIISDHWRVVGG